MPLDADDLDDAAMCASGVEFELHLPERFIVGLLDETNWGLVIMFGGKLGLLWVMLGAGSRKRLQRNRLSRTIRPQVVNPELSCPRFLCCWFPVEKGTLVHATPSRIPFSIEDAVGRWSKLCRAGINHRHALDQ